MAQKNAAVMLIGLVLLVWGGGIASAQQVHSLLLEAEGFQPTRGDWLVGEIGENYYAATIANTFLSGQMFLGAPEQGEYSEAKKEVDIPEDGDYLVWTRYEQPCYFVVEHGVRIQQAGKVKFDRVYGRFENLKLWPFGNGFQAQLLWPWGGGDNIVWESSDKPAKLEKGRATIVLYKDRQPRGTEFIVRDKKGEVVAPLGAAKRNIDVVYLSTDLEEGERQVNERYPMNYNLSQAERCFLRVANPSEARYPIILRLDRHTTHNPYGVYPRWPLPATISKLGGEAPKAEGDWIGPGDSSPWVPIGQGLDSLGLHQEVHFSVDDLVPQGAEKPKGMDVILEFAQDRGGKQVIRSARYSRETQPLTLEIPGNVARDSRIMSLEEYHEQLLEKLKALPQFGKTPERIPVHNIVGGGAGNLGHLRTETGLLLGRNVWEKGEVAPDLEHKYEVKYLKLGWMDGRGEPNAEWEKGMRDFSETDTGQRVLMAWLGDEISVGGYDPESEEDNAQFREYLKAMALLPAGLGVTDWQKARLTPPGRAQENPRLHYWSEMFNIDRGIDGLKKKTDMVERIFGPGVYTEANYSPHPDYWPKVGQWVRVFKRHGMTMPCGEDYNWQVPEMSMQVTGYLMDVLRCGAKYENMPIYFLIMPHSPGQTAKDFTLSALTVFGHGNKGVGYFGAVPTYDYTENYTQWDAIDTWKAIRDVTHSVGAVEDFIVDGKVRPAQVAILLSEANDIWEQARDSSIYNFERQNLYYALRHSQIPVDFLTDEDVTEGWLENYKVLYVVGDHVLRAAAEKIRDWVGSGGVLFSVAGGGFLDEYNQPLHTLKPVYGIADQSLALTDKRLWVKQTFAWIKPLDQLDMSLRGKQVTIPALVARQELFPTSEGEIIGRFGDGKPAVVRNRYGSGTAVLVGTFPGSAYVHKAIPKRPWDRGTSDDNFDHFIPTDFDLAAKALIGLGIELGGVKAPAFASEPLVDLTVIDSPSGMLITLANYSRGPIENLRVTVREVGKYREASSVLHGPLKVERRGDSLVIELPLVWGDFVTLREPGESRGLDSAQMWYNKSKCGIID